MSIVTYIYLRNKANVSFFDRHIRENLILYVKYFNFFRGTQK